MARLLTAALLMGLLALSLLTTSPRAAPAADCVTVRAEARYRNYGYDHLVHLKSTCPEATICEVSTDVQPKVHRVTLAPGASATVITMVGSPARAFTPRVSCSEARRVVPDRP